MGYISQFIIFCGVKSLCKCNGTRTQMEELQNMEKFTTEQIKDEILDRLNHANYMIDDFINDFQESKQHLREVYDAIVKMPTNDKDKQFFKYLNEPRFEDGSSNKKNVYERLEHICNSDVNFIKSIQEIIDKILDIAEDIESEIMFIQEESNEQI